MDVKKHSLKQYWVVTCPVSRIVNGVEVWRQWYREEIVAVGFPPTGHCEKDKEPGYSLDSHNPGNDWEINRQSLCDMNVGDKIIPFLLERRIGPVGTIRTLQVKDGDWCPTIPTGVYTVGYGRSARVLTVPELGRRIEVEWQVQNMPPEGEVALVNPGEVVSRSTVRRLSEYEFERYTRLLESPKNRVVLYRL